MKSPRLTDVMGWEMAIPVFTDDGMQIVRVFFEQRPSVVDFCGLCGSLEVIKGTLGIALRNGVKPPAKLPDGPAYFQGLADALFPQGGGA